MPKQMAAGRVRAERIERVKGKGAFTKPVLWSTSQAAMAESREANTTEHQGGRKNRTIMKMGRYKRATIIRFAITKSPI